jgi:tetratricopeptide (TPR) repeat protein
MKWLLAFAVCLAPHVASGQRAVANIQHLIDTGHLADAESAARAGGDTAAEQLGEVLVMRGRLAAADSVFRSVVARRLPASRAATAGLAELAMARGDHDSANAIAGRITAAYAESGATWSARDLVAAGRAFVILGRRDPTALHDALRAFDRATAIDSSDVEAQWRAGDLLLATYNDPDARASYAAVLRRAPAQPRALLGIARADAFEGSGAATPAVRQALAIDPELVPALVLLAELDLEAEAYDSALVNANHAIEIDSAAVGAWGIVGAIAWMRGDSTAYRGARAAAERWQPAPVDFYAEIAEAAGRQRRYAAAVSMAEQAVRADSTSARAFGVLAENQLRTGAMVAGRANLERAFALDPYNLWHKNTLDLLDNLDQFTTVTTARFQFVAPADEADYLALYLGPLLDSAYDAFAARYDYRPPTPIRVELYDRHADFSVRTVGLTGLGALGVSFGTLLVLDSPRAREIGELNYGSTAWHELAHTFTLGLSAHRVPRWLSEGLSVREEQRPGDGWGDEPTAHFIADYKGGALPTATHLNEGLVRPQFPEEIGLTYYEASLVCLMIEQQHGIAAIRAMLTAYAGGLDTPAVLQQVLGTTPEGFDAAFDAWLRARFAGPLSAIDSGDGTGPTRGTYADWIADGTKLLRGGAADSGRALLRRAEAIFPDDGTSEGAAWMLAHDAAAHGDTAGAVQQLHVVTMHDETAVDANTVEARWRLVLHDSVGALAALARQQWISPYDIALHTQAAELSEAMRDWPRAVRERRAIVAIAPPDPLEAGYQLARVLLASGDADAARHEILHVLEQAPAFEKAQALLLHISRTHP